MVRDSRDLHPVPVPLVPTVPQLLVLTCFHSHLNVNFMPKSLTLRSCTNTEFDMKNFY